MTMRMPGWKGIDVDEHRRRGRGRRAFWLILAASVVVALW